MLGSVAPKYSEKKRAPGGLRGGKSVATSRVQVQCKCPMRVSAECSSGGSVLLSAVTSISCLSVDSLFSTSGLPIASALFFGAAISKYVASCWCVYSLGLVAHGYVGNPRSHFCVAASPFFHWHQHLHILVDSSPLQ